MSEKPPAILNTLWKFCISGIGISAPKKSRSKNDQHQTTNISDTGLK